MEREREDISARRRAQDAWREGFQSDAERRKREAEQNAAKRDAQEHDRDAAWRRRWWDDFHRTKERARQKTEEHKQWSSAWWEQWKETSKEDEWEDEEEEDEDRGPRSCGGAGRPRGAPRHPPPPPPAAAARVDCADQAQVLAQLRSLRSEPLEERKRAWRLLCLQWHPDKCGGKEHATAMFQHLQGLKDWFLAAA